MKKRRSHFSGKKNLSTKRPQVSQQTPPSQMAMVEMLLKAGISLNLTQQDQLWKYHQLIRKRNTDRELTRIIGFEPMVIKHYVDCMIVPRFWSLPSPLVDVGTGAGFPGIPLKILLPSLDLILAEPRPKRIAFLNEVIQELGLQKIDVFEHKVVSKSFTTPVKGVITRAVETMDKTALRTSGSLQVGGQLIFMKGPQADDEVKEMKNRFQHQFKLLLDKPYQLPGTQHDRRLIVFEKTAQ